MATHCETEGSSFSLACSCAFGHRSDCELNEPGELAECLSHWSPLCNKAGSGSGSAHWCRRLFVVQWGLRQCVFTDEFEKLVRNCITPVEAKIWGVRGQAKDGVFLYQVMVLLDEPWDCMWYGRGDDAWALFPSVLHDKFDFVDDCHFVWCAPCHLGDRREAVAGWVLSLVSFGIVVFGKEIVEDDIGSKVTVGDPEGLLRNSCALPYRVRVDGS